MKMKEKMSIIGIGFKLVIMTFLYSILIIVFSNSSRSSLKINFIPYDFLFILGIILLMVGIPFLIISMITLNKAYKADSLRTDGVYSICRHPLYSSWIIFIVPGIGLLSGSWIILTIPIIMYFIFRILIKQEELYLQNKFGEEYINYKNKVSLLFPMFWRYERKRKKFESL
jgi:protein-S-isoprenylcysteine O-methyltransferase Ste14